MTDNPKPKRRRGSSITRRQVAAGVILVVLIAFAVDNTTHVRVGFVFFHADLALIWVLIITMVLGMAVMWLLQHRRTPKS